MSPEKRFWQLLKPNKKEVYQVYAFALLKGILALSIPLGIQSITGSVIADGSGFSYDGVPDGWSWNDIGNYYGAGPSGICLFDNMVSYYFKTGSTAGSPTTLQSTFPEIEKLVFRNRLSIQKRAIVIVTLVFFEIDDFLTLALGDINWIFF